MTLSRILADWMAARILLDGTHSGIASSLAEGDEKPGDRITIKWDEVDSEVEAGGPTGTLRRHEVEYTINTPTIAGIDMAQHRAVEYWLKLQFGDSDAFNDLKTAITNGLNGELQSWFLADHYTDNDRDDYRTVQEVRIWIVG